MGTIHGEVAGEINKLQKIACQCDVEIAKKNKNNKMTCQFLGVLKHKCCDAKIRDKNKEDSNSCLQGETGYKPGKPPEKFKATREEIAKNSPKDLKGSCWPDACITDGKGNPVKFIDFKFKCPKDTPIDNKGKVCSGKQPNPSWTEYSAATGFANQKEKYIDLSERLGLDPKNKKDNTNEPEIIDNTNCP